MTYDDAIAMRALPHVVAVGSRADLSELQTGLGSVSLKHGTHKIENTIVSGATTDVTQVQTVHAD